MKLWKRLVLVACVLLALCAAATLRTHRSPRGQLFHAPPPPRRPAVPAGALIELRPGGARGAAGVPVVAVHYPAPAGAPTLVCFHGDAEQLADLVDAFAAFRAAGLGVYAVEYPGYGLNAGSPSEAAFYATAQAALAHLRDPLGVPPGRTILVGRALGASVAVEMAARGLGAGLVLLSPCTSLPDVAARGLGRDRFDAAARAPGVTQPVLILHGTDDEVFPAAMARRLGALFPHATTVLVPGAHHGDLFAGRGPELVARIAAFARANANATAP